MRFPSAPRKPAAARADSFALGLLLAGLVALGLLAGCTTPVAPWPGFTAPQSVENPTPALPVEAVDTPRLPPTSLQVAGQAGGQSLAVTFQDGRVYLGVGPRLVVLDATDPATPVLVAQSDILPALVQDVAVSGGHALVAADQAGLLALDVGDASGPRLLGFLALPRDALTVAMLDQVAAVAAGRCYGESCEGGLYLVDIRDPAAPRLAGSLEMPDYAYDVAVTGNLAIVAHGQGLQFADISDPASPVEVSRIDLEGGVRAVVTDGQMAYAAGNGIWVVDLADPAQPAQIGRFKSNGPVHALASNGNVLYAAEVFCEFGLCGSNLLVLDVSRPGKPQQAGIAGVPGATATISIHGDLALVATLEKGLNLVDITRPKKPEVVGTFQALGSAMDVAARPGFVLVTNAAENGLLALDTSRPLTPLPVGALETLRWASGLVLDGGLAYVPAWEDGLRVVDVSDPANMAELGVLSAEAMDGAAFGVDVRRGPSPDQVTAYVAVGSSGLRVLDVGDPANPLELGRLDVPGDLWNVAAMDQAERVYLLAVGGNYENDQRRGVLRAIDATDPANLREVGTLSLLDEAWGVTVAGGIAYVVAAGCSYQECAGSLSLVDVSQPETPHLVSAMDVAGGALGLTVVRDMAYLAAGESGVLLVDVSNPENLELVAQVDTPGSARQVVLDPVIPGVRYVADGAAGLIILQEPGQ